MFLPASSGSPIEGAGEPTSRLSVVFFIIYILICHFEKIMFNDMLIMVLL